MAPTDWTSEACWSEVTAWPLVMLWAASWAGSRVTVTSSVGAPVSVTLETPASPFSLGRAAVLGWPARSPSGSSDETAYVRIGRELVEKAWIVGAGTEWGRSGRKSSSAVLRL